MSVKRWRGLKELVQDSIDQGSTAVEQVHRETARWPFDILERIPGLYLPTRGVRVIHDATLTIVYSAIRVTNRALGQVTDVVIDAHSSTERERGLSGATSESSRSYDCSSTPATMALERVSPDH